MSLIKDSLKVILLSSIVSFSVIFVFAQIGFWDEPDLPPPGDNRLAPLTLDAQGGLTVPGNLKLDGAFAFQGTNFKVQAVNEGEDSYTGYESCLCMWQVQQRGLYDTTPANSPYASYGCAPEDNSFFRDLYWTSCSSGCAYVKRDINCIKKVRIVPD